MDVDIRGRSLPYRDALVELAGQFAGEHVSAQELIGSVLRRAILTGVLPSGTWLRQRDLAAVFGTSRIPVRESLYVLESEGLLASEAYRGFMVTGLDSAAVEEVYEMRSALEGLAVRIAVPLLTEEDLEDLRALKDAIEDASDPNDRLDRCEAFHLRLYEVTERPRLVGAIRKLRQEVLRTFRWEMGHHPHDHEAFATAVLNRDVEGAVALLDSQYARMSALLRRGVHRFARNGGAAVDEARVLVSSAGRNRG